MWYKWPNGQDVCTGWLLKCCTCLHSSCTILDLYVSLQMLYIHSACTVLALWRSKASLLASFFKCCTFLPAVQGWHSESVALNVKPLVQKHSSTLVRASKSVSEKMGQFVHDSLACDTLKKLTLHGEQCVPDALVWPGRHKQSEILDPLLLDKTSEKSGHTAQAVEL